MARYTAQHIHQLLLAKECFLRNPDGVTVAELAMILRVSRATADRYRRTLRTYCVKGSRYSMLPSAEDILLAHVVLQRVTYENDGKSPHKS